MKFLEVNSFLFINADNLTYAQKHNPVAYHFHFYGILLSQHNRDGLTFTVVTNSKLRTTLMCHMPPVKLFLGLMDETKQDNYTHPSPDHLKAFADIVDEIQEVKKSARICKLLDRGPTPRKKASSAPLAGCPSDILLHQQDRNPELSCRLAVGSSPERLPKYTHRQNFYYHIFSCNQDAN